MNKTPLIVTAGNQRRFMQNQYCLLTNIDPTTVPKPFVKWAAEPDPTCLVSRIPPPATQTRRSQQFQSENPAKVS